MTTAPPILQLDGVTLRFGGLTALDRVDLRLDEHELLALIGPNGGGKTSLLNCVNAIYRPSSGVVSYLGEPLGRRHPHDLARAGVARTFQLVELVPEATVLENVLAGRQVHVRSRWPAALAYWGRYEREQEGQLAACEELIELLELERVRERRAGDLALGTQRLVGLARALAMEPRLLLLDEPSSGMSREEREDLARFLVRVRHDRPTAMLWVEHDTQLVSDLADRIVVLQHGRTIADGAPAAVLADPAVIEAYVGSPRGGAGA